jgi:hypothetical protein
MGNSDPDSGAFSAGIILRKDMNEFTLILNSPTERLDFRHGVQGWCSDSLLVSYSAAVTFARIRDQGLL